MGVKIVDSLPKDLIITFAGDVSKFEDAKTMVDVTVEFGDKLDVLVNNAGIDPPGSVVEVPVEQWQEVINTNLTGPFLLMKAAIPHMVKNGGGSIVNIASLAAVRCIPTMPAYCASKAGLIGLTQQAALDYGPNNIRCNVVCPGAVRTEMLEHVMTPPSEALQTDITGALLTLTKFTPLRRPATPGEISGIVVYLANDDFAFMTGAVLMLDGRACVVDPNGAAIASSGMAWGGRK